MLNSILLRTVLIVAMISPLLMPTVTRSESFGILFVFEDSKQTDGADLVALIEGGYAAGHEVGMKGQIVFKKGRRRGRKRAAESAEVLVQDVSLYESSVLIKGVEAHRIKSKHTVDLEIPQRSGSELRQRADSYYVVGAYDIARCFYARAFWEDHGDDSQELVDCYYECRDSVAAEKLRPMSPEQRQAELKRWPAYWALAWMYIGRSEFRRANEYNDKILRLGVHEGEAEQLSCQLGQVSPVDLINKDSVPALIKPPLIDVHPEMIKDGVPTYPPLAKAAGITGVVWVKSLVGQDGSVIGACAAKSSGSLVLDIAAVKSAYECKFKPGYQNDKPIACWVVYKVAFVLD